MTELSPSIEWPGGAGDAALVLVIMCLVVLFDICRRTTERLTVSVGAIRLAPPTLVALPAADTSTAVGLLGGVIADYLAASDLE